MKQTAALLLVAVAFSTSIRADIPGNDPKVRTQGYASRTLNQVISQLIAIDEMVISEGPEKEKQTAAKEALKADVEKTMKSLSGDALTYFKTYATEKDAQVATDLKTVKEPVQKEKLLKTQKALQTLRERYLQAMTNTPEPVASIPVESKSNSTLYAGIALGLAAATGGLMFLRRSSSAK